LDTVLPVWSSCGPPASSEIRACTSSASLSRGPRFRSRSSGLLASAR
jgi:hypothetical protein